MSKFHKVKFKHWDCFVQYPLPTYNNGRHVIRLLDMEDSIPVAVATINVPDFDLEKDEVIIKDYSENAGIYKALVDAKVIQETDEFIPLGNNILAPICKLLIE